MNMMISLKTVSSVLMASLMAGSALVSTALAQDNFGGLPSLTVQGAENVKKQRPKREKIKPSYVVVDQGGDDREKRPGYNRYTTIGDALKEVADNGVVVVLPGTYEENITIKRGVSLQGDRAGGAVEIVSKDQNKPCLEFKGKFDQHVKVSNITFRPQSYRATAGHTNDHLNKPCIHVNGGHFTMVNSVVDGSESYGGNLVQIDKGTAVLEKNHLKGGMNGILVEQNDELWDRTMLVDNIVSNNLAVGIHVSGKAPALVTGNHINYNMYGVHHNGSGNATVVGNTILNNTSHGVLLDNEARQVLVRLNQIWSNKGAGIHIKNAVGVIGSNDIDGNVGFEISTSSHFNANAMTISNDTYINEVSCRPKRGHICNTTRH